MSGEVIGFMVPADSDGDLLADIVAHFDGIHIATGPPELIRYVPEHDCNFYQLPIAYAASNYESPPDFDPDFDLP